MSDSALLNLVMVLEAGHATDAVRLLIERVLALVSA